MPQPKIKQRPTTIVPANTRQAAAPPPRPRPAFTNVFKINLANNNLDGCLQLLNKEKVSVIETSQLIEKLIHENRLNDAINVTMDMLNRGTFPVQKIFRYVICNCFRVALS